MLESISWQQFFATVSILLGGYYILAFLLLYSKEIIKAFTESHSVRSGRENNTLQTGAKDMSSLMGGVRHDSVNSQTFLREEIIDAEVLNVVRSSNVDEPVSETTYNDSLTSDAFNLLQEVKTLLQVTVSGNKEEKAYMFQTLLSRYPQLVKTAYREEISKLIHNTLQRQFDQPPPNEIDSWWPEPRTKSQ